MDGYRGFVINIHLNFENIPNNALDQVHLAKAINNGPEKDALEADTDIDGL